MRKTMLFDNTPVEVYRIGENEVHVKREDMACNSPGPPFSKVRGLMPVLQRLKKEGVTTIGYTETSVSMAGWGVAWGCWLLGLKAVIFDPQYKKTPSLLAYHRKQWVQFEPDIIPLKAGMAKVNWYISRKILKEKYGESTCLLPLGLPFPETVEAAYVEAVATRKKGVQYKSVVVNVGSGTIAAGVAKAFSDITVYGIMGRSGSTDHKINIISQKSGILMNGLIGMDFRIIDPGWEYTESSKAPCPFPCHPYYDLKAWQWLVENIEDLEPPVLFWNIGKIK